MKKIIFLYTVLFLTGTTGVLNAQEEINKEVRVIKPYTPTLSDAERIGLMPEFNDTSRVYPDFKYEITPKRFATNYRVNPISPAKMVGLPLKRLYKSQFSLGIGNYLTPLAELNVNQLRDRKNAFGLYLKHHSSGGKIKLENDKKVDAGFSDDVAGFYGRKMFSNSVLESSLNGAAHSILYYGYNPVVDTVLDKKDIRQKTYSAGARLSYYSSHPDSSHFNYKSQLSYNYFADNHDFNEQEINISGTFAGFLKDWYGSLETGLSFYKRNDLLDSTANTLLEINPALSKATDEWRFMIGLKTIFDMENGSVDPGFYPNAEFEFNIVKNVLIPYMGVTGYRQVNTYRNLLANNPFVSPGTLPENTDYFMIGYLGMKGRYSSKMAFDFRLKYSQVENMYFYVNSLSDTLLNKFGLVYDNLSILNAGGEISWDQNEKLKFILRADYFKYDLDSLEYAWHKPDFKASLNVSYNLRDKIMVDANLFFNSGRKVLSYTDYTLAGNVVELKPYFDANLSAEYRYTSMLSFFLKLNNLSATGYQQFFLYPVQRFQAMIGFSYAL